METATPSTSGSASIIVVDLFLKILQRVERNFGRGPRGPDHKAGVALRHKPARKRSEQQDGQ